MHTYTRGCGVVNDDGQRVLGSSQRSGCDGTLPTRFLQTLKSLSATNVWPLVASATIGGDHEVVIGWGCRISTHPADNRPKPGQIWTGQWWVFIQLETGCPSK